jgi:hypothetical protein
MDVFLVVIAVAVAVIASYILLSRFLSREPVTARAGRTSVATGKTDNSSTQWRAVKVSPGLICCDAVSEVSEQVFLSRLAPSLPLDECSVGDCRCKYIHLEDRRSGGDRRAALGELEAYLPFNQEDRRSSTGRRVADLVD